MIEMSRGEHGRQVGLTTRPMRASSENSLRGIGFLVGWSSLEAPRSRCNAWQRNIHDVTPGWQKL
jgi:hypothetical protein